MKTGVESKFVMIMVPQLWVLSTTVELLWLLIPEQLVDSTLVNSKCFENVALFYFFVYFSRIWLCQENY